MSGKLLQDHRDKIQTIDLKLLQSDWLNAKYNYILFFNDSTVLTAPNENRQFLFEYHTKADTLFIQNISFENIMSWEKYQILTLNSDILIMENISKNNSRLPQDTIALINTKTINYNNLTYKKILFSYSSGTREIELEIIKDSLTFTEYDFNNKSIRYHCLLSIETVNQINRKLELLDPGSNIITVPAPGMSNVSLKIEFNENVAPIDIVDINPMPNLRVAGIIAYLNNLDKILKIKEER